MGCRGSGPGDERADRTETDPQLAVFSVNPIPAPLRIDLGDPVVNRDRCPRGAVTADSTTAYVTTDRAVVARSVQ